MVDRTSADHAALHSLTEHQHAELIRVIEEVSRTQRWSWQLPVLLHDSSWLRLSRIQLNELQQHLPPDNREDPPELSRYRRLLRAGVEPLRAQQQCWEEFGMEDCQRALRRYWDFQDHMAHGWTISRYLDMVSTYRTAIEKGNVVVPLLSLAQQGSQEIHRLHWISDSTPTMRHTCA